MLALSRLSFPFPETGTTPMDDRAHIQGWLDLCGNTLTNTSTVLCLLGDSLNIDRALCLPYPFSLHSVRVVSMLSLTHALSVAGSPGAIFVPAASDFQRCGRALRQGGVGVSQPQTEDPLPGRDAGKLQELHRTG